MFILRTEEYGDPRLRFSPSGQFLALCDEVWSIPDRALVYRESEGIIGASEWNPVADEWCVPRDSVLRIVTPHGEPVQTVPDAGWVQGMAFAPAGDWLITFSPFTLTGWKRARSKWRSQWIVEVKKTGPLKYDSFESVAVFPDGRRFVTMTTRQDRKVTYAAYHGLFVHRDVRTGAVLSEHPIKQEEGSFSVHTRLSIAPDGSQMIGFHARSVLAWPTDSTQSARRTPVSKKDVRDVALHPSGRWVLVANGSPEVSVWDTAIWKRVRTFDWKIGNVECADISADGLVAATTGETGKVAVWDWDL